MCIIDKSIQCAEFHFFYESEVGMCSYVSPALEASFKDREQKAIDLIKKSDIQYVKIGIFGSYARKEYKTSSDIDICVIVNKKPSRQTMGSLREDTDLIGVDLTFVTPEYFNTDDSNFAKQLRRDFAEVK